MIRTAVIVFGAAALSLSVSSEAVAQSTSLFGSSGSQSSASQSGTAASNGLSSSGQSSGGGLGSGGGRSGGAGQAFQGPQIGEPGSGGSQSVGRGTGFVGQQNQGFVGNRMAGTGGTTAAPPSLGGLGNLGGGGSNFNNQRGTQQGSSSRRAFRPRYRIGFSFQHSPAEVAQRVNEQAGRLSTKNPALSGLDISVDEQGMAEIRGQAPSADARTLIENLVRLEPGVRRVNNLVEVMPAVETP